MTEAMDALLETAAACVQEGRLDEAEELCRRVIARYPFARGARFLLGRCEAGRGHIGKAADAYRDELAVHPDNVDALNNLGVCHYEFGQLDEAEACFRAVIGLRPLGASSWNNLGSILLERGDAEAAAPFFEAAVARDPSYAVAQSNRLRCEQYRVSVTPERVLALARDWASRFAPEASAGELLEGSGTGRIRLGFFSPDLFRAPMGYFLVGLLEALDRRRAEVWIYSDTPRSDDLTGRMRGLAAAWFDLHGQGDDQVVQLARSHHLDVAIDAAGHTKGNRLRTLAARLAPVQILWAGYAGSSGVPAVDYLLADRIHVREGEEAHYSERILRLPNDYICYVPPEYAPAVGPLPAQRADFITFGGFHNAAKVGSRSLALWSDVLRAVPTSRLLLKYMKLDDPRNRERILGAFAANGIDPGRILIEGISPHLAMLARYNDVDIALDSLPYSGGLTTLEALWMGVPVVTLPGTTFAGRHSASHLTHAGFPELVAASEGDYVGIAVRLARDWRALEVLRAQLRPALAASPICDTRRFAQDFLDAIESVSA